MFKKLVAFIREVLSEPDGTPSTTRTLMYIFSFFSMWLIWRSFYHMFRIHDPALVSIWLSNMPMLITTLIGLISLPYAVNKGTSTFSDIATMIANAKQNNVSLSGSLSDLKSMMKNGNGSTPTPIQPSAPMAPPPAVGTPGVKG